MDSYSHTELRSSFLKSQLLPFILIAYALACLFLAFYLAGHPASAIKVSANKPAMDLTYTPFQSKTFRSKPYASEPLPDFADIRDVKQKKSAFFNYLRPAIEHSNQRVSKQRQVLLSWEARLNAKQPLDEQTEKGLQQLLKRYKVKNTALNQQQQVEALIAKIDQIPASMILAQGALESAWGSSRFARQANNLFGQWCFVPGCGIVPLQRNEGAIHEVKSFASVGEAVEAYFYNINANAAYKTLRDIRLEDRRLQRPLTGKRMVGGLELYSGRGMSYVHELRDMIRSNKLEAPLASADFSGQSTL